MASDGGTNFGGYSGLSTFPPIRSWAYLTDYCLHYRKYVTNPDPQLSGVTTMLPPQPVAATNAGDLYSYYERIHRHPLIARIQYVFASSASGSSPAFIAQPVVTLWNPFNVRLTVPSDHIVSATGGLAFTKASNGNGSSTKSNNAVALAGALLHHGTGPMPLILLMLASSALSILSTLWVMLRARQIA